MSPTYRVSFVLFLAVFAGVLLYFYLSRRRRRRGMPNVSDREFLDQVGIVESVPLERILAERGRIARILGVPKSKLHPNHTYKQLAESCEFMGRLSVGWSDLEYELLEDSAQFREYGQAHPLTIGSMIRFRLEARVRES